MPDTDATVDDKTSAFAGSKLVSYRYVGCNAVALDHHNATGRMRIRSDLRSQKGLLAAPLAIAMLDAAGITVDPVNVASPIDIALQFFDDGTGVEEVVIHGSTTREARKNVFTEARIVDAADPGRLLALGSVDWAVIAPQPEGFRYGNPGPGVPDEPPMPPLTEVFGADRRDDGSYAIPGLGPTVGTGLLHHGPMLVTVEAAARDQLDPAAELTAFSLRIVRPGKTGPFVTSAEVVPTRTSVRAVRAQLVDEGGEGAVVAVGLARF
jgi:acyl-coenzyme A thioesterase PaaI-like protein